MQSDCADPKFTSSCRIVPKRAEMKVIKWNFYNLRFQPHGTPQWCSHGEGTVAHSPTLIRPYWNCRDLRITCWVVDGVGFSRAKRRGG